MIPRNLLVLLVFAVPLSTLAGSAAEDQRTTSEDNPSRLYQVGGDIKPPLPLDTPQPKQTEPKHKTKHHGRVLLWAIVGEDGSIRAVRVARSLNTYLDESAIAAVKTWEFQPATRKGKPVAVQIPIEVNFNLY